MKYLQHLFLIVFLFGIIVPHSAQDIHSMQEIFAILDKSDVSYTIEAIEEEIPAVNHWAKMNLNLGQQYRIVENERIRVLPIELDEHEQALSKKAEALYANKEYAEARAVYKELYTSAPEFSKISTYIGQTYEHEKNLDKAMEWYKNSIEQNPIDYLAHWFISSAYWVKGEEEKAIQHNLRAHLLNRNHKWILETLNNRLANKKKKIEPWQFTPQVNVDSTGENKVRIQYKEQWLSYALVKACWEFEPGYREKMGVGPDQYTMLEEKEALFNLYAFVADEKKYKKLPYIKALKKAVEKKLFDEYILYEIMLPKHPQLIHTLPDDLMESLTTYLTEIRMVKAKKRKKKK